MKKLINILCIVWVGGLALLGSCMIGYIGVDLICMTKNISISTLMGIFDLILSPIPFLGYLFMLNEFSKSRR